MEMMEFLFQDMEKQQAFTSKFLQMSDTDDIQDVISQFFEEQEGQEDKPVIQNAYKSVGLVESQEEVCITCHKGLTQLNGEILCTHCGTMANVKTIDETAEWRYYGAEDSKGNDPTRCGMPVDPLLPKSSLSTMISGSKSYMGKLHAWNSIPYKERSLRLLFVIIQNICVRLNLPGSVILDAKSLYKVLHEKFNTRGKNRNALVGACILFAAKNNGFSVTTKMIADSLAMSQSHITEGCKTFVKMMYHTDFHYVIETSNIDDYIIQCGTQLNMSNGMIAFCKKVAHRVEKMEILLEHTPPSIAIGCIYLICHLFDLPITKKHIHETCNISEVTITKTFKKIEPYQHKLLLSASAF